jgi:ABC-type polysaccharide/polyol phosphate export permease
MQILSNERARADLFAILYNNRPWRALAAAEIRSKYRRTTLGPLWITISTGATILGIGVIYGQFFGQDVSAYLPYFAAGMVIWGFISSVLNESATALISAGSIIKASNLPVCFHNMRMMQRNFIIFLHNLLILVVIWLFVRWPLTIDVGLAIVGIALLYLFLSAVSIPLSLACVRYRDIPPLIQAATTFLFFASPIIWYPENLRSGRLLLELNPLAHFLAITRDPLLGRPVDTYSLLVAIAATACAIVVAALLYARYRDRVAYWV